MRTLARLLALAATIGCVASAAAPARIDAAMQRKIDGRMAEIKALAADPEVVQAVKRTNDSPPPLYWSMNQDKWSKLSPVDPLVRAFTRNDAATVLKTRKTDDIAEAFICAASGAKVAFLSKPTGWSHRGTQKHETAMTGRTWQGPVERNESTGIQLIEVSVPVLDGDKPIGSLVVGLAVSKLQ